MSATRPFDQLLTSVPAACRPAVIRFLVDIAGALGSLPPPEPARTGLTPRPQPGEPLPIETLDELAALLNELQLAFGDEDPPIAVHYNPDQPQRANIVNITLLADGSVAIALSANTRDGDPAAWRRKRGDSS